jgi:hypothetical protein
VPKPRYPDLDRRPGQLNPALSIAVALIQPRWSTLTQANTDALLHLRLRERLDRRDNRVRKVTAKVSEAQCLAIIWR